MCKHKLSNALPDKRTLNGRGKSRVSQEPLVLTRLFSLLFISTRAKTLAYRCSLQSNLTMKSLRVLPKTCSFLIFLLLPFRTIAQGELALYLDSSCTTASQLVPKVSLPVSTCLVLIDVLGIAIDLYPSCSNSNTANMII